MPASSSSSSVFASRSCGSPLGLGLGLGRDHDEAARALARLLLQRLEQLRRGDRLVRHDERALRVVALGVEVHHHVLHGAPRCALHAVHEALPQPSRARLGMGGDHDLVVVLLAQRVHHRRVRVGVHHLAVRLDAGLAQQRQRHLEPVLGGVAHVLVVDHVAVLRLVLRADHVGVHLLALGPLAGSRRSAACRPPSRWPPRGRASSVVNRRWRSAARRRARAPRPVSPAPCP